MMKKISQVIKRKIETWKFQWKCSKIRGKKYGLILYSDCLNAKYISPLDNLTANTRPYPKEMVELYHSIYTVNGTGIESNVSTFYNFLQDISIEFEIIFDKEIEKVFDNPATQYTTNISDVVVPSNQNDFIIKYIDNDEIVQIQVFNFDIYKSYFKQFSTMENFDIIDDIPLKSMFDIWMRNTLEELSRYSEISRAKIIQ